MSDFLGARISLISKSDIRYVGTLFEINSNESTVSLENVRSHGTEGRKGDPSEEVSASDQVYDFIVFRGSDVKDLRIEEGPSAPKENQPPPMPNDPAIVGARSHPGRAPGGNQPQGPPGPHGPPGPPGAPGFQNPNMFPPYPPPPQGWGRPGPPGPPGPAGFGMGYPPQGWFPPAGQGFPPNGPGPWNNYPFPPGPPVGPQGPQGAPGMPQQQRHTPGVPPNTMGPQSENRPAPIGAGPDKSNRQAPVEMPSEPNVHSPAPTQPATNAAPTPPVASKPSAEEVKVTAALLETQNPGAPSNEVKQIPTGPKGLTKITPAMPLPAALTAKAAQSMAAAANPNNTNANPAASAAALKDATEAAKAAVAVAMAKLEGTAGSATQTANGVDNLTRKVDEMRINAARTGAQNHRGRGRGGPRHTKVEVPDSDYDFEGANAKFNKEDMVKERIAGSPLTETPQDIEGEVEKAVSGEPKEAYNKTKSFFDNISSEAKDRKDNNGQKPGGREWRGEEQRRNMETFGQGSVDGGYRGFRGRGRGRGMRGRGFVGRGRGGYRGPRNDAQPISQ
ncbi:Protein sum2 [Cytospora mali]|uniref:Protein sum2 n=1 Tax=Cytospora mali TaxID=578113 RepID=A0A194VUU9_CYTMA|nr:Protein sum2 [Valsa mali]